MSPAPTILLSFVVCLALASFVVVVRADEESLSSSSSGGQAPLQGKPLGSRIETHGFSLSNGYGLNALLDQNGSPNANVKLYGGGRLGPGGAYYRQETLPAADPLPAYVDTGSSILGLGVRGAFVTGAVVALALWYSCLWLVGSKRLIDLDDLHKVLKGKDETKEKISEGSSRRRRDIKAAHDDSLTRLAEIVLTSIESGQCMQKSICLVGTQLGATGGGSTKTALVAKLLEQMIPASVQHSAYFVTLQAALRRKLNCDELRCGGSGGTPAM